MDDIANKCGVSKKTIYKYFENKSDLLQAVIKLQVDELKEFLNEMNINSANSLEELHGFFKYWNGYA